MCPLDVPFQTYVGDAIRHLAALKPAFIMIDDDFRLLTGRNGCYCPLHLAEIGERLGRTFTRESLLDTLRTDAAAAQAYDTLLEDSLIQLAKVIRKCINEVDPSIPGSFCTCTGDIRHAGAIARTLAGEGHPRVVRINNARYLKPEMRSFSRRMYDGAGQIAALDDDIIILAETDTCPHNRYSTGANLLHSHYTGSILEGCHGAKHWITYCSAFQPASGTAYRTVLTKYHGFYQTLFEAVQNSVPSGYVAAALPNTPFFNTAPDRGGSVLSGKTWGDPLGVFGLPCNYAKMPNLPAMMTGADVELFLENDVWQLLTNGLVLEGLAAEKLCQRGFAAEIGIMATSWDGPQVSAEQWGQVTMRAGLTYSRLTPLTPEVKTHSTLVHRTSGVSEHFTELGPAVTLFENALGGRVATFAETFGQQGQLSSFGFYSEDRKREILELLQFVCGTPVEFYYPGDAEVYLKLRRFTDGRYLLACFNLGHDPLEVLPINAAFNIAGVELIAPDGSWQQVEFADECLQTPLFPAEPKVFRVTVE